MAEGERPAQRGDGFHPLYDAEQLILAHVRGPIIVYKTGALHPTITRWGTMKYSWYNQP